MNEISDLFKQQDVRIQIREYLRINKINLAAVAKSVGVTRGHLKRVLDKDRHLSASLLSAINHSLNTQFQTETQT